MKKQPSGWEKTRQTAAFYNYGVRYEQKLCGSPFVFSCKENEAKGCKSEHHGKSDGSHKCTHAIDKDFFYHIIPPNL